MEAGGSDEERRARDRGEEKGGGRSQMLEVVGLINKSLQA